MEIKVNYVIMRITRISSTILLLSSDGNFLNKYQNDEYFMMDRDYLAFVSETRLTCRYEKNTQSSSSIWHNVWVYYL